MFKGQPVLLLQGYWSQVMQLERLPTALQSSQNENHDTTTIMKQGTQMVTMQNDSSLANTRSTLKQEEFNTEKTHGFKWPSFGTPSTLFVQAHFMTDGGKGLYYRNCNLKQYPQCYMGFSCRYMHSDWLKCCSELFRDIEMILSHLLQYSSLR